MLPTVDELREQITTLRTRAGLTQAEAADQAGVSQSFVAKLENGRNDPRYTTAVTLYNALKRLESDADSIREVMSAPVVHVTPDETVDDAAATLKENDYSQLPVITDGRCVGSVTSTALVAAPPDDPVSAHMDAPFPTVPADVGTASVGELLQAADAVLVQGENSINGIVTASDLI